MADKNPVTQLRFTSKKQKLAIKKMAVKNGRSLNAEINQAIDLYILHGYFGNKSTMNEAEKVFLKP